MNRISKLITVIDNFVDTNFCNKTYKYLYKKTNQPYKHDNNMPWFIGNNVFYDNIDNKKIQKQIRKINYTVANLFSYIHGTEVYPHLCDLVLWRAGQSMDRHVDDGSNLADGKYLEMRKFSAICYLNDNYVGGKTFIKNNENEDYVSTPKTGTLVMFTSDNRSAHGVAKIESGTRGTLAMWFSTDKQFCNM